MVSGRPYPGVRIGPYFLEVIMWRKILVISVVLISLLSIPALAYDVVDYLEPIGTQYFDPYFIFRPKGVLSAQTTGSNFTEYTFFHYGHITYGVSYTGYENPKTMMMPIVFFESSSPISYYQYSLNFQTFFYSQRLSLVDNCVPYGYTQNNDFYCYVYTDGDYTWPVRYSYGQNILQNFSGTVDYYFVSKDVQTYKFSNSVNPVIHSVPVTCYVDQEIDDATLTALTTFSNISEFIENAGLNYLESKWSRLHFMWSISYDSDIGTYDSDYPLLTSIPPNGSLSSSSNFVFTFPSGTIRTAFDNNKHFFVCYSALATSVINTKTGVSASLSDFDFGLGILNQIYSIDAAADSDNIIRTTKNFMSVLVGFCERGTASVAYIVNSITSSVPIIASIAYGFLLIFIIFYAIRRV